MRCSKEEILEILNQNIFLQSNILIADATNFSCTCNFLVADTNKVICGYNYLIVKNKGVKYAP